jgi:hypothetical protein
MTLITHPGTTSPLLEHAWVKQDLPPHTHIEFLGGDNLNSYLQRFDWAKDKEPAFIEAEFQMLLHDLFRQRVSRISLYPLATGHSGAGVLRADPYYGTNTGTPVVLKIGPSAEISREEANYSRFIEPYLTQYSSRLGYASGSVIGILSYQLIGGELDHMVSLADYYFQHPPAQICQALDNLFRGTCRHWYDNREQPRRMRNLVELYEQSLHIAWDKIWHGAMATGIDLNAETLCFPGLTGNFINPKHWLESRIYTLYRPVFRAMSHGDMNENNILVTADGRCWLIDFYRSGWSHSLSDAVELETSIKFTLTQDLSLAQHYQLEKKLLDQTRLDRPIRPSHPHPFYKPLITINQLRRLADLLTGCSPDMTEYNEALLLATLNLLRLDFLRSQHSRILLSASMLCQSLKEI